MKLFAETATIFLSINIISISILSGFLIWNYQDELINTYLDTRQILVNEISNEFSFFVDAKVEETVLLSKLTSVRSAMELFYDTEYGDPLARQSIWLHILEDDFSSILESSSHIDHVRLVDLEGREVLRVNRNGGDFTMVPFFELQDNSDRYYIIDALKVDYDEIYISEIDLNQENNKVTTPYQLVMRTAAFVTDDSKNKLGLIVINYDMNVVLSEIIPYDDIVMFNQNGKFVFHYDDAKLYDSQLKSAYDYFVEQPELGINVKNLNEKLHHDTEEQEFRIWKKIPHKTDSSKFWVVLSVIDEDALYAPIKELTISLGYLVIPVIIASIIVTLIYSKRIVTPIKELVENTRKISNEQYGVKLSEKGNNEITTLNRSFNTMTASLAQSKTLIEGYTEELQKSIKKLKEIDRLKEEFSSMLSHELRTPLTPILLYCEMLNDKNFAANLNDEQREYVQDITENVQKLDKLIEDMHLATKSDLQQLIFDKKNIDVNEVIKKTITSLTPAANKKNIKIVNLITEKISINADELRLSQVFTNLIRNALDFVAENTGVIKVGAIKQKENITFYVKDNGIGMTEEQQDGLFTKFYQANTEIKRNYGGTGLGLTICKGIVEGHGGKIWVDSGKGLGSTFYFQIPLSLPSTDKSK